MSTGVTVSVVENTRPTKKKAFAADNSREKKKKVHQTRKKKLRGTATRKKKQKQNLSCVQQRGKSGVKSKPIRR